MLAHRPPEFSTEALAALESASAGGIATTSAAANLEDAGSGSDSSDDGRPPLTRINNRKVVEYYVSDDTDEE